MPTTRPLEEAFDAAAPTGGLLTRRALRRAGVSDAALSRAVRAKRVVRVRRRVYARAPLPPRPQWLVTEQGLATEHVLAVRALLMSWSPSAVATGRTAALLRGRGLLAEPRKHASASTSSLRRGGGPG